MIGSHDSYTCCKSTSWWYNHCKKFWKTQKRSVEEQYQWGVRLFDIRVCRDGEIWRTCHGVVNLTKCFKTLREICDYMSTSCPEAIYRIILEKGVENEFKQQALNNAVAAMEKPKKVSVKNPLNGGIGIDKINKTLCDLYPNLWRVDIKSTGNYLGTVCNNNKALYDKGYKFAMRNTWDPPSYEMHGQLKASNIFSVDLRKEAKRINTPIFKGREIDDLKNSKEFLYFLDYCTNEY